VADALVIGAGVIGLTSAICLAEGGMDVRIRTAAPPQETTSRAASAMWGSSFAGPADDVRRWARQSLDDLRALAAQPDTGVRIARGMLASRSTAEGPPEFAFPGVEVVRRAEAPPGFVAAFAIDVPVVDMPRHLDYLLARFQAAGGDLEVRPLRALSDVAGAAPVVVNCSGVGARELVPDPPCAPCAASTSSSRTRAWRSSSWRSPRRAGPGGSPTATTSSSAAAPTRTTGASSPTSRWPTRSCAAAPRSSRGWRTGG
jgi:D-amino-acid oxidase